MIFISAQKIQIQVFILTIILSLLMGIAKTSSFDMAEIHLNVPKGITDLIGKMPAISSVFKSNNLNYAQSSEGRVNNSIGPMLLYLNIQRPQQYTYGHMNRENNRYVSPAAEDVQAGFYGYYYALPTVSYDYGSGYYSASPFQAQLPSFYPPLQSLANGKSAEQYLIGPLLQYLQAPSYSRPLNENLSKSNPSTEYDGTVDQNLPVFGTSTISISLPQHPQLQRYARPVNENKNINILSNYHQPQSYVETVYKNLNVHAFETLATSISDANDNNYNPLPQSTKSSQREKPMSVILPDSPFYIRTLEEPAIYGIEPRR